MNINRYNFCRGKCDWQLTAEALTASLRVRIQTPAPLVASRSVRNTQFELVFSIIESVMSCVSQVSVIATKSKSFVLFLLLYFSVD